MMKRPYFATAGTILLKLEDDLATPFFAADYTFDHLGLDASLRGHLSGAYYEAGHMMYVHPPSLAKLKQDIAKFMGSAMSPSKTK
jgi:carboxypeptidase C (cathepsin A)